MTDLFPGRAGNRQLVEWGYPMGALRPTPPASKAFSTIHITGNSNLPSAQGEIDWRANDPALQNSATFFVNRDGSVWQALGDPLSMDPWANGDVNRPDTTNPRIAAMVADGVNANERTIVAIENVGYEPGFSITSAQEASCARIIAYYHAKAGVPVTRQTVIGHYQLNSVSRPNCPGVNKALIDRIVALAAPETDVPLPLIEEYEKFTTKPGGIFYTDGWQVGTPKSWADAVVLEAIAKSPPNVNGYSKVRLMRYQDSPTAKREVLYADRAGLLVVPGTLQKALPIGVADCTAQVTAAREATASKGNAQMDEWTANRPKVMP